MAVTIIGKVAVKVYPDTDDFHRQAERQLRGEEKRLKVEVPVEADGDKAEADLRELLRELKRRAKADGPEIKAHLDRGAALGDARELSRDIHRALNDVKVKADVEQGGFDAAKAREAVRLAKNLYSIEQSINRENEKAARVADRHAEALKKAAVEADRVAHEIGQINFNKEFARNARKNAELLSEIDDELREIARHENLEIEINLEGMSKAERKLSQLQDELAAVHLKLDITEDEGERRKLLHKVANLKDDIEDELDNIQAEIKPNLSTVLMRAASARLKFLARDRIVTLVPLVSKKAAATAATALAALSGARLGGELLKNLKDLTKNLDKNIPKIAAFGLGIAGLSGWALSASANLFSLSAELAKIGPIGLALPGILSGMVIALGVSIIAFSQMGKVLPEVVDKWGTLKGVISDNFWSKAAGPIREMTDRIFPDFAAGMAKAATEMGGFFGSLGQDLSKQLKGNPLKSMFDDLSESIAITTSHTSAFARIITILGKLGAGLLPRLARWFGTISDNFAAFLEQAEYTGQLQDWIDQAIVSLKQLGRAVYQVGRFFGVLGKIANQAGGSKFQDIADTFGAAADKLNEAHVQTQFVETLKAADRAMENIANKSGPGLNAFFDSLATTAQTTLPVVGDTIGELIGGITEALSGKGFQDGLLNFFSGIQSFVHSLKPAFKPAADALGEVLKLAGRMATAFGPGLSTGIKIVSDAIKVLAPYVGDAVSALGGPFGDILEQVAPAIDRIARAVGPKISEFAKGFGQMLKDVKPDVGKVFDKLAKFVENAAKGFDAGSFKIFFDALGSLLKGGLGILGDLLDFLTYISGPDGENARKAFELLAAAIEQLAGALTGLHNSIAAMNGTPIPEPKPPNMDNWWNTDLIGPLAAKFRAYVIKQFTFEDVDWTAIGQRIQSGFRSALTFALGSDVVKLLLGPVGTFVVDGLLNGFSSAWARVNAWWSTAIADMVAWVKGLLGIQSPSTVFIEIGGFVIAGLLQGLRAGFGLVTGALGQLASAIKGVFAGAGGWLRGAGSAIVNGLRSGIDSARGLASAAARAVVAAVKAAANVPSLLVSIGRSIGSAFARAISATVGLASAAAGALIGAARSGASGAGSALVSAGQNIGRGLANGMRAMLGTVRSIAAQLASAAAAAVRSKLSINSPSKLMHQYGVWTGEGFANGIASMGAAASAAGVTMANASVAPFEGSAGALFTAGLGVGNGIAQGIESSTAAVRKSLTSVAAVVASTDLGSVQAPTIAATGARASVRGALADPSAAEDGEVVAGKVVNFNITNNNPLPENTSTATNKVLRAVKNLELM